ncbi:class II aldolase/adducin family protein [PVC group bacterium]|nr:class II aldolase/adducin family protein [PVC group bacterium]
MKNIWNSQEAKKHRNNPLRMRVYSSRLIGQEPNLVLHGGGNTSVKACIINRFGESEKILYVKGSGADLATIESKGFSPVRLSALKKMAKLECLGDEEMVSLQRSNMTDPNAPNPSVEAILHAIIPFDYVDHTHADAVVTLTNTPHGKKIVQEIYGTHIIIVPYIMPGFILAKKVYELTKNIHWENYEGMILLNHGVFTWGKSAKTSYDAMIQIVSKAENYLKKNRRPGVLKNNRKISQNKLTESDCIELAKIRKMVSILKGSPMMALLNTDASSSAFSKHPKLKSIACRGPLTPDHVIRTKPIPVILGKNPKKDIQHFSQSYKKYFQKHANGYQTCLDGAPRWAVWQGKGIISFGESYRGASIVADIVEHTIPAILSAESLGGWRALPAKDIFDMEDWVLEQMKLKKKEGD